MAISQSKLDSYISLAKSVAIQSEQLPFRHGAVLVSGKTIANTAHNSSRFCAFANRFLAESKNFKNSSKLQNLDRYKIKKPIHGTLHAEIGAILNQSPDVTRNADVYVVRVNRTGNLANSFPCPMCQATMIFVGIRRVFYSSEDGSIECLNLRDM